MLFCRVVEVQEEIVNRDLWRVLSRFPRRFCPKTQPTFCRLLQLVDARKVEEIILGMSYQRRPDHGTTTDFQGASVRRPLPSGTGPSPEQISQPELARPDEDEYLYEREAKLKNSATCRTERLWRPLDTLKVSKPN
jgi:hypothetical protein